MKKIRHFLRHDKAASAVEYAILIGLIVLACFSAITMVGQSTATSFSNSAEKIDEAFNED